MKKAFMITALLIFCAYQTALAAVPGNRSGNGKVKLTITVSGIGSSEGKIMVGIYDRAEGAFEMDSKFDGVIADAKKGDMTFTFELPEGSYAVGVIHDRNGNGKLDRNFLGIPTEDYGFSGKASSPDYKKAVIAIERDMGITIKLR